MSYTLIRSICILLLVMVLALHAGAAQLSTTATATTTLNAWGSNAHGKLGDGTTVQRNTPVPVSNLAQAAAVSVGEEHSLALRRDGIIWAWGRNNAGQLGDGTRFNERATPGQVPGFSGVMAVSAGAEHSLGLKADGTVWAWGGNNHGQLGDGSTASERLTPTQVVGLEGVAAIAAGAYHSVALRRDGTVWAWGNNFAGRLGNGTIDYTPHPAPSQVSGLAGVVAISAGDSHTLALRRDGTIWAWGDNNNGQVGDGTGTTQQPATMQCPVPVPVIGMTGVVAVAAGTRHSLALTRDGTVWEWGTVIGTTNVRRAPVQVSGLIGVVAVSDGGGHSLALRNDGTVWSWGLNNQGQLGDGSTNYVRPMPAPVSGLRGVAAVAAGPSHSLVVRVVTAPQAPAGVGPAYPAGPGKLPSPPRIQ